MLDPSINCHAKMNQPAHTFADRLTEITVTGGLIRLEFGTLVTPVVEGKPPQFVATQTLVMPLEGFVDAFGTMDAMLKKLTQSGVLHFQAPHQPSGAIQ
jgi:hypothetical protein